MDAEQKVFARALLDDVSRWLGKRESEGQVVSRIAGGAAFEAWLAFEARLAIAHGRSARSIPAIKTTAFWTANEYPNKTDLSLGLEGQKDPLVAIEVKLIHNNKNWKKKADEVWADLFPARSRKQFTPKFGRIALVGVVYKVHEDRKQYPGQVEDRDEWLQRLDDYLMPKLGWNQMLVRELARGPGFKIRSDVNPPLHRDREHFFELRALVGGRAEPS